MLYVWTPNEETARRTVPPTHYVLCEGVARFLLNDNGPEQLVCRPRDEVNGQNRGEHTAGSCQGFGFAPDVRQFAVRDGLQNGFLHVIWDPLPDDGSVSGQEPKRLWRRLGDAFIWRVRGNLYVGCEIPADLIGQHRRRTVRNLMWEFNGEEIQIRQRERAEQLRNISPIMMDESDELYKDIVKDLEKLLDEDEIEEEQDLLSEEKTEEEHDVLSEEEIEEEQDMLSEEETEEEQVLPEEIEEEQEAPLREEVPETPLTPAGSPGLACAQVLSQERRVRRPPQQDDEGQLVSEVRRP
ncbi:trichohyalin-like [Pollicipes pollicipes]|uniref:trichohyalin-like n=1 Tax=Pollicipes pollicipes TaxID=41117 RepID=UPI0018856599|nr:trichohyalin-like [Pollicipes pollicipes]